MRQNKFNFQENNIQIMDFETLKKTHKENDIYHYEVIERVANCCADNNLNFEIEEIFAAQNNSSKNPSVVVLPQVEQEMGENAIEAHILRKLFCTIKIDDGENAETNTTLGIAYHQGGFQAGFGPSVKVCHNQTITNASRLVQNYGEKGVSTDVFFENIEKWIVNFFEYRENDLRVIEQMKNIRCTQNDVFELIGLLTSFRVRRDSKYRNIATNSAKIVPFNQSQISKFTEDYLLKIIDGDDLMLWDIYNIATNLYKLDKMEIPNVLEQNIAFVETVQNLYNF